MVIFKTRNGRIIDAPIKQKGELKLGGYWPLNPNHGIDPFTDP